LPNLFDDPADVREQQLLSAVFSNLPGDLPQRFISWASCEFALVRPAIQFERETTDG